MSSRPMPSPGDRVKVVCADDEPDVRWSIAQALRHTRFALVAAVGTVMELEAALRRERPSALLLDVDIPHGEPPLAWLARSAPRYPELRVVVYSGYVSAALVDEALDAGAWGYIDKLDSQHRLPEVLDRVLADEMVFSPSARQNTL